VKNHKINESSGISGEIHYRILHSVACKEALVSD